MAIVYYLPGYYPNKTAAGTAYTAIEQIIHDVDYDLLAYRLMRPRDKQWLVVVISQQHTHGSSKRGSPTPLLLRSPTRWFCHGWWTPACGYGS